MALEWDFYIVILLCILFREIEIPLHGGIKIIKKDRFVSVYQSTMIELNFNIELSLLMIKSKYCT